MTPPLISVITWDAGFRESYHTVDFFSRQTLAKDKFEFIWADYYSTIKPELAEKIEAMGNGKTFCYGGEEEWHLGQCLNAAVRESRADLIVIPDGDIVVEENFLSEILRCYENKCQELVIYFRRWDELKPAEDRNNEDVTLPMLRETCKLNNPTNYGGCLVISKSCFDYVQGYEEHGIFSQAGANGMELYVRLKNAGLHIMWHPTHKIYHPWHMGSYPNDSEYSRKVNLQNWLIRQRDLNVTFKSDIENVEHLILKYQNKLQESEIIPKEKKSIFCKIKKIIS
jgi:hypothetical protein